MYYHSYLAILTVLLANANGYIRLTNVKCTPFDLPFASFSECKLKVIRRNVIGLNITVNLHQVPVNNVSLNFDIYKKASGYRPFLYNISMDFCAFMKNHKRVLLLGFFMNAVNKYSNINHTCPYGHDIIVKNYYFSDEDFKYFPIPEGDYWFRLTVGAYNHWKAEVGLYFTSTDQLYG